MPDAPSRRGWLGRAGHKRHTLGWQAERFAARRLSGLGYRVLARNVSTPVGEIDLIAEHRDFLVFIEVRSRREDSPVRPRETITVRKQRHIVRCAESYMRAKNLLNRSYRFDVVEVVFDDNQRVKDFGVIEAALSAPRRR